MDEAAEFATAHGAPADSFEETGFEDGPSQGPLLWDNGALEVSHDPILLATQVSFGLGGCPLCYPRFLNLLK